MTLGEIIRTNREALGMTQEDLSVAISVSTVAISNWETNKSVPRKSNLKKLARLFQIEPRVLINAAKHNHSSLDLNILESRQPIEVPNPQDNQLEANANITSNIVANEVETDTELKEVTSEVKEDTAKNDLLTIYWKTQSLSSIATLVLILAVAISFLLAAFVRNSTLIFSTLELSIIISLLLVLKVLKTIPDDSLSHSQEMSEALFRAVRIMIACITLTLINSAFI